MKGANEPITETEREKFRRIVNDARTAIRERDEEIDALTQDLARAHDEIEQKGEAFRAMQGQIDRMRVELENAQIEIGRARSRAKTAESAREGLMKLVDATRASLGAANIRLLANEGIIRDLRREVEELRRKGPGPSPGFESLFGAPRAVRATISAALPDGVSVKDLLKLVHPDRWAGNPDLEQVAGRLTRVLLEEKRSIR